MRWCDAQRMKPLRRAFTLLETLVAVGIVALVGVGLAAIFGAVSDTVSGGQRVSRFARQAALIEQQMRRDFDAIAADGYLVIRHQFAEANPDGTIDPASDGDDVVGLSADGSGTRMRRIDEIVFFARGDFESARAPLHPDLAVRSNQARVYYGHGRRGPRSNGSEQPRSLERAPLAYQADSRFGAPGQVDAGGRGLGVAPNAASSENPNQFAEDWILLRHVTVLATPSELLPDNSRAHADLGLPTPSGPFDIQGDLFNTTLPAGSLTTDATSVYQGQPAARFLFRDVVREMDVDTGELNAGVRPEQRARPSPRFDSGLVDIAMTSIEETREIVQRHPGFPFSVVLFGGGGSDDVSAGDSPLFLQDQFRETDTRVAVTGAASAFGPRTSNSGGTEEVARLHQWMEQLLPAASVTSLGTQALGERIRAEIAPPELDIVRTEAAALSQNVAGVASEFAPDIAREDQFALSMANLAPRCSEFIVEWSFGQTYSNASSVDPLNGNPNGYLNGTSHPRLEGELVWYGGASVDPANGEPEFLVTYPVGDSRSGDPRLRTFRPFASAVSADARDHVMSRELLYGTTGALPPLGPLTTYFGTIDPTYPQDGDLDADAPFNVPWAWPKLIRVTLSLADPIDPSIEERYQFVFELPERRSR